MSDQKCPIGWTTKDGPFPCAFYQRNDHGCSKVRNGPWSAPCIPMHKERFYHSTEEKIVPCFECGKPVTITNGEYERYHGFAKALCRECSDKIREGELLLLCM